MARADVSFEIGEGEAQAPGNAVKLLGEPIGHLGPNPRRHIAVLAAAPDMRVTETAVLTAAIRQSLLDLATNGAAVIVISQDLDEFPRSRNEDERAFR